MKGLKKKKKGEKRVKKEEAWKEYEFRLEKATIKLVSQERKRSCDFWRVLEFLLRISTDRWEF